MPDLPKPMLKFADNNVHMYVLTVTTTKYVAHNIPTKMHTMMIPNWLVYKKRNLYFAKNCWDSTQAAFFTLVPG